ncbi:hypothetical protein RFI_09221, partial [Reticulomyxa filosa]
MYTNFFFVQQKLREKITEQFASKKSIDVDARMLLAKVYTDMGKYEQAQHEYEVLLHRNILELNNLRILMGYGNLLQFELKDYISAEYYYDCVLHLIRTHFHSIKHSAKSKKLKKIRVSEDDISDFYVDYCQLLSVMTDKESELQTFIHNLAIESLD